MVIASTLYFYLFNFAVSLCMVGWYREQGIKLYPFATTKYLTIAYSSLYFTLIFLFAERVLLDTDLFMVAYSGKWVVLLMSVSCFLCFCDRRRRLQFKCMDSKETLPK